jgi:hypothetical protein
MTPIAARPTALVFSFAALVTLACSSSNSPVGPVGGPVTGALDSHCGSGATMTVQPIGTCVTGSPPANQSMCGIAYAADTGAGGDAGAPADDAGTGSEFGATLYNASGFDDDCKYQVAWTATPIRVNTGVTFTVVVTRLDDMQPAKCAGIYPDVFLNDTHAGLGPTTAAPESPPGTYKVGPVKFDVPGMWNVRFHLYGECSDAPDSPHGHVAFYVNVPDPTHPDGAAD